LTGEEQFSSPHVKGELEGVCLLHHHSHNKVN
jgi:hypothetical protein